MNTLIFLLDSEHLTLILQTCIYDISPINRMMFDPIYKFSILKDNRFSGESAQHGPNPLIAVLLIFRHSVLW